MAEELSPLQVLQNQEAREKSALNSIQGTATVATEMSRWPASTPSQPEVAAEEGAGFFAEVGKGLWGGTVDAIGENLIFLRDAARWILPLDDAARSVIHGESFAEASARNDESADLFSQDIRSAAANIAPENESVAGGLLRGVTQFLVPYTAYAKAAAAVGGAGRTVSAFAAGFATDVATFNPNDPNLSSLVEATSMTLEDLGDSEASGLDKLLATSPDLSNVVTGFLATDPGDPEALNRLRNGLEGLGIGGAIEGLIQAVRGIRGARAKKALVEMHETAEDVPFTPDPETAVPGVTFETKPGVDLDGRVVDELNVTLKDIDGSEGGRLNASLVDDGLKINESRINETLQGQGNGVKLYETAIDQAQARGLKSLLSDSDVSAAAVRVWESLRRAGYTIIENENYKIDAEGGRHAIDEAEPLFTLDVNSKGVAEEIPGAPPKTTRETVRETVKMSEEQRVALNRAVLDEDYSTAARMLDFNSDKFDWDSLADGDNLRSMLNTFSEVLAENIDTAKGGVRTMAEIQRMSKLVGATPEQSTRLFADVTGNQGIAARMTAAHRLLISHGERIRELAAVARDTKSSRDVLAVTRAVELQSAIMGEVKGSQTEIARALAAMRQMRQAERVAGDVLGEIEDVLRITGGGSRSELDALMKALAQAKSVGQINVLVRSTAGKRLSDALAELVLNGLLSLPKTQVLNFASNMVQAVLYTGDRYLAGAARFALRKGDMGLIREANADAVTKLTSMADAWRLAVKVFKEGKPITDPLQRIEVSTRQGFNAQAFNVPDEHTFGRVINWIGRKIRVPGKFLLAGDEFFKYINVRGETAALSYRQASVESNARSFVDTAARERFMARRMADLQAKPPVEMQAAALHQARLATFQERGQTAVGPAAERFINSNIFLRLIIAPFFRTPMNILRQSVFDRTVLGVSSKHMREAIARGGEERAIALARMTTGTAAISMGYLMVGGGGPDKAYEVTGRRPWGSTERLDGAPDYGLRIGSQWYTYNRLDPIGTWLGMAADIHEGMNHFDPEDPRQASHLQTMGTAAVVSMYQNTISKSWMQSVADLLDLAEKLATGKPETQQQAVAKFAADQAFKLVPFSSLVRGSAAVLDRATTGEDAEIKDVWAFMDEFAKNIPIWNRDLPPLRDYLGRPVTRQNSEWFMVNPFAVTSESDDPLDQALSLLAFNVDPLPKSLRNGDIPLTANQYSEFKELIGQHGWFNGNSLETMMRTWATNGTLESFPTDELRVDFLRSMWSRAKNLAEQELKQRYPELRDREAEVMEFEFKQRFDADVDIDLTP